MQRFEAGSSGHETKFLYDQKKMYFVIHRWILYTQALFLTQLVTPQKRKVVPFEIVDKILLIDLLLN